jgi:hypothetical protein
MSLMKVDLRLLLFAVYVTDEDLLKMITVRNKNKTTEIIYNPIKHDCFSVDSLSKHLSILPEGKKRKII